MDASLATPTSHPAPTNPRSEAVATRTCNRASHEASAGNSGLPQSSDFVPRFTCRPSSDQSSKTLNLQRSYYRYSTANSRCRDVQGGSSSGNTIAANGRGPVNAIALHMQYFLIFPPLMVDEPSDRDHRNGCRVYQDSHYSRTPCVNAPVVA